MTYAIFLLDIEHIDLLLNDPHESLSSSFRHSINGTLDIITSVVVSSSFFESLQPYYLIQSLVLPDANK